MKRSLSVVLVGGSALGWVVLTTACSGSSGSSGTGGSPASGGTPASGGISTGGALASGGSVGTGGSSGGAAPTGGVSSGGSTATGGANSGGSTATGGSPSGGAAGTATGGATAGGNSTGGASGGSAAAGTGGTAGAGNTSPHGSAAKFNCTPGATYGDPISGVGAVQQIGAPQSDYFAFIEGPVWISKVGTLFFSDIASSPSERIFKVVVPPGTSAALFVGTSGSNGLAVGNDNQIVAADQRNKRIVRFDSANGQSVGTAISTGNAKPNDVLVRSDGTIYFTDPDTGFYQVSTAGVVSAAMKPTQGSRPNGIALSLDENTLYVGDVGNKSITKYTVAADGTVMTASAGAFVAQTKSDTLDGMCVDCAGNVYGSTSNGVEVYTSAGSYIGTIPTGEASNCTFGGADRKTLYVTSRAMLKYVTLNVPGLPD